MSNKYTKYIEEIHRMYIEDINPSKNSIAIELGVSRTYAVEILNSLRDDGILVQVENGTREWSDKAYEVIEQIKNSGRADKKYREDDEGNLYLIMFNTGSVKVGKSRDAKRRISQHRSEGSKFGVSVNRAFVTRRASTDYHEKEAILIEMAWLASESRSKNEYFHNTHESSIKTIINEFKMAEV